MKTPTKSQQERSTSAPTSLAPAPSTPANDSYAGPWRGEDASPCESLRDARRAIESRARALAAEEARELQRGRDGGALGGGGGKMGNARASDAISMDTAVKEITGGGRA